ncbi:MAG: DNRLRE domain-containing protein, partial [Bifidobacteriaceae bacterium]|nr:DNRLRE domain-containing protein [Bifidobacteriaceae bacterium]
MTPRRRFAAQVFSLHVFARALAVAAVGVVVVRGLFPQVVSQVAAHAWAGAAGLVAAAAGLGAVAFGLVAWLARDLPSGWARLTGPTPKNVGPRVGQTWLRRTGWVARALGVWLALALTLGLLTGGIAVALRLFWGQQLSLDALRSLVDAAVVVIALVSVPAVFAAVVQAALGANPFGRTGARVVWGAYPSLGVVVAVGAAAGFGIWSLGSHVEGAVWSWSFLAALVLPGAGAVLAGLVVVLQHHLAAARCAPGHAARHGKIGPLEALKPLAPSLSPRARRALTAGTVALVTFSLIFPGAGPLPEAAGAASAANHPAAGKVATPVVLGAPNRQVPDASEPSEQLVRDPQPYYAAPEPEDGELVDAGDDWATYKTGERSYRTVVGGVQATYTEADGTISQVDNRLMPVGGGTPAATFKNAANDFDLTIPAQVGSGRAIRLERSGFALEMTPRGGDFSRASARGNAVLFNDVLPGVDYQYSLIGSVVKEDIVLNRLVDVTEFRAGVTASSDLELDFEFGALVARAGEARGDVEAGDPVFTISAPAMVDAAGAFSDAVEMVGEVSGTATELVITPSRDWLEDPARAYPVRVDPVVDIASAAVTLVGVEQGSPNMRIGDNGFPYAGYDDGVASKNLVNFNTMHMMTRTYAGIGYDFQSIMREARIDAATFTLYHYTPWSHGNTEFGLYAVDQAWSPSAITWNNQMGLSHTFIESKWSGAGPTELSWNVREQVNNWVQGIAPQNGLVVKATDERWMQAEVFSNKASPHPPRLVINWSVPDPVDPAWPLNDVRVNVRPVTEKSMAGKQIVDGVFADGLAQPDSYVDYRIDPDGQTVRIQASRSYKYPNSADWEQSFPSGTKYSDKLSNWQTGLYGSLRPDTTYRFHAKATAAGDTSPEVASDRFLVYEVKQRDTLPFIAAHYGVPLDTLMRDNRVQDTLATGRNTLFIRNPNTAEP